MPKILQFPKLERPKINNKSTLNEFIAGMTPEESLFFDEFTSDLNANDKEYLLQYSAEIVKSMGSFAKFTSADIDLPENIIVEINKVALRHYSEYMEQIAWIPQELLKLVRNELTIK